MPFGNIKTRGALQDDLFCVKEERDFFESKYLEQVSEIKAMKDELAKSKKEIRRLRMFLMEQENQQTANIMPEQIQTPKKNKNRAAFDDVDDDDEDSNLHIAEKDDASSLTQEEMEDLDKQDERLEAEAATTTTPTKTEHEDEVAKADADVRQSAEKLLAWASYRSRASSRSHNGDHDHSSTMSPSVLTSGSTARQSLLGKMIETMEDDEDIEKSPLKTDHIEEKKEGEPALAMASLALDTGDQN